MAQKLYVTGAGIVSALGVGMDATLQSLLDARSGIGPITHLSTGHTEFPVGEVALTNAEMSSMLRVGYPMERLRTALLGTLAAREAVQSAALTPALMERAAFISGTTVGGMDNTEAHFASVSEADGHTTESAEVKYNDCGYSTDLIADSLGGRFAMVTTSSTACSSAANAIIFAANLIRAGVVDVAVAGGAEALSRFHLNGFNTLMILDREPCRPFSADRVGINLGEGAAYLVIESEESARRRGAHVMAELSGYGNACDAFHQTATSDSAEGPYRAMTQAMHMAGITPADVDYVNAHGTGTPNNDASELTAMRRIWGDNLPPFSSTKSATGHTTSASGSIEAAICLLALGHGFLPATVGRRAPAGPADATPVTTPTPAPGLRHVINNSFGFGGNDSSLIFSKPAPRP